MIMRLSLSITLGLALATAACARDVESDSAIAEDPAISQIAQSVEPEGGPAYDFPEDAWRDLDPENTLYIDTPHGLVIVELAPEFAPNHVDRMKTLARQRFYDFLIWHRVIDGFMAQGGGSRANPNHGTDLPNLEAEFMTQRGPDIIVSELQERVVNAQQAPQMAQAGFYNGFHAGTQPIAQAMITATGQVNSWLLHCQGAAAMARTSDPNSAGSQFYITRGSPDHLNAFYTVWGRVRHGQDAVNALAVGTHFQDPGFTPDVIRSMRVEADLPEDERTDVQVVDTNHAAFAAYLDTLRSPSGDLPDICEIDVPTRVQN